jgi:hypothetical protein
MRMVRNYFINNKIIQFIILILYQLNTLFNLLFSKIQMMAWKNRGHWTIQSYGSLGRSNDLSWIEEVG